MKFAWIQKHRDSYRVAAMCRVLIVSQSGFYAWAKRTPGPRAQPTAKIRQSVSRVYEQSNGIYGSQKVTQKLADDDELET